RSHARRSLLSSALFPYTTLFRSYVGNHGFHLLQNLRGTQAVMDLNAPDFGTAYLPQNQDPTLAASSAPGATAPSWPRPSEPASEIGRAHVRTSATVRAPMPPSAL